MTPLNQKKSNQGVLRFSKWNSRSIFIFGIIGTIAGIVSVSLEGILMGGLIAGAGWIELQGHHKLADHIPAAGRWLMGGEGLLLFVILVYAGAHLMALDPAHALDLLSPDIRTLLSGLGGLPDNLLNDLIYTSYKWLYQGLIGGSLVYQGSIMTYYYFKTHVSG